MSFPRRFFGDPLQDLVAGLDRCLASGHWLSLLRVMMGALVGWMLYVPLHELLHAAGCIATGGSVTRLEVAPLYGGHLLAQVIPFVVAGGEYAGRLSGFDTGGSDFVYLATDLAPFLLVIPGIWGMKWAGLRRRALSFGAAVPFALAPFLSVTGDAYEIGSIVVTWLPWWQGFGEVLRRDDLVLLAERGIRSEGFPWGGVCAASAVGIVWAFATYGVARWLVWRGGRPAIPPSAASSASS